jgi:Uma2 family endonuclease
MPAIALKLEPILPMTDENFRQLCHLNPEAKLELTAQLELVIMTPTGGSTGMHLTAILWYGWSYPCSKG